MPQPRRSPTSARLQQLPFGARYYERDWALDFIVKADERITFFTSMAMSAALIATGAYLAEGIVAGALAAEAAITKVLTTPIVVGQVATAGGAAEDRGRRVLDTGVSFMTQSGSGGSTSGAATIVSTVPAAEFRLGNCVRCADLMQGALTQAGIHGQRLSMRIISPLSGRANWKTFIWSDRAQANIADNGVHEAVQVGNIVFDNLNRAGLDRALWEADLFAPGKIVIITTLF